MIRSKEDKIIEHGKTILKELQEVYIDGIGVNEYEKLLNEYIKICRRYTKTIKHSDSMSNYVMNENGILNENLKYTINKARDKLMNNVVEHRKTKEVSSTYLLKIKEYSKELKETYKENKRLEIKMSQYIKTYGELQTTTESIDSVSINPENFDNITIEHLVLLELSKNHKDFVLSKVSLKNFEKMITTIENNSTLNNFLLGIYKFIENTLKRGDIIFHYKNDEFYIITKDRDAHIIKNLMEKLNLKRKILGFEIEFIIGITQYTGSFSDTYEQLLKRCNSAFIEAKSGISTIVLK